jgi:ribonuclease D
MMSEVSVVTRRDELQALMTRLRGAPYLALDSESNSLHAYREQVCWLQLESGGAIHLIDTVALRDLSPLAPILEDPRTLKILHGADYDVLCLKRDFGLRIENLFDTAVAGNLLGYPELGLAALVQKHFAVTLDKALAKHDWRARPVDQRARTYLAQDVVFLYQLCGFVADDLRHAHLEEEAEIEFARVAAQVPKVGKDQEDEGFRRIKGAQFLDRRSLAVLKEVWRYREGRAAALDVPSFRVLHNDALIALSELKPRDFDALRRSRVLSEAHLWKHGDALISAIAQGRDREDEMEVVRGERGPRPSEEQLGIDEGLREWRKRRMGQESRTPLAILPNPVIERIAERKPTTEAELAQIEGLGSGRLARYAKDILAIVRNPPAPTRSRFRRNGVRAGPAA